MILPAILSHSIFLCLNCCVDVGIWRRRCPVCFDLILVRRNIRVFYRGKTGCGTTGTDETSSPRWKKLPPSPFQGSCSESLLSSDSFRLISELFVDTAPGRVKRSLSAPCWKSQAKRVANFLLCTLQNGTKNPLGFKQPRNPTRLHGGSIFTRVRERRGGFSSCCQFLQNLHPRAFDCPRDWHNAAARGAGDAKRTDGRNGTARLGINEREPAMMLVSTLQIFSWLPCQFTCILFFFHHVSLFKRLCPRFFVSLLKTITPDHLLL